MKIARSWQYFGTVEPHNHPPPFRVPLDEDIKQDIKNQALNGKKPCQIEQVFLNIYF